MKNIKSTCRIRIFFRTCDIFFLLDFLVRYLLIVILIFLLVHIDFPHSAPTPSPPLHESTTIRENHITRGAAAWSCCDAEGVHVVDAPPVPPPRALSGSGHGQPPSPPARRLLICNRPRPRRASRRSRGVEASRDHHLPPIPRGRAGPLSARPRTPADTADDDHQP